MDHIASDNGTLTVWVATRVSKLGEDPAIDLRQASSVQGHHLTSPVNQLTDRNLLHVRVVLKGFLARIALGAKDVWRVR